MRYRNQQHRGRFNFAAMKREVKARAAERAADFRSAIIWERQPGADAAAGEWARPGHGWILTANATFWTVILRGTEQGFGYAQGIEAGRQAAEARLREVASIDGTLAHEVAS